jgi:hypothetical protein
LKIPLAQETVIPVNFYSNEASLSNGRGGVKFDNLQEGTG